MADNYQVGNLEIAFKSINQTSADFKNLANSLKKIQYLIGNIANADISKFSANIKSITADLSPFLTKIQEAETSLSSFANLSQQLGIRSLSQATVQLSNFAQVAEESASSVEHIASAIEGVQEYANELSDDDKKVIGIWEKFSDRAIKSTLALERQRQQTLRNKIAFLELSLTHNETGFSAKVLQQELAKLQAELGNNEKTTKKSVSGWSKFIKSIGRIALYRAIRRALQLITQSVTETIQEFAKLDDNVNDTMSSITSSLKVIQYSFGATILPLLQMIEPILSQIAIQFADFANIISQAMAMGDTYWAINAEAIKDYREQLEKTTGSLASFDKINSLNAKDTFSFFELKQVDKENQAVQKTREILDAINNIIQFIGEHLNVVAGIIGGILAFKLILKVKDLVSSLSGLGSVFSLITAHPIIALIGVVVGLLTYLYLTNEDFRKSVNDLFKSLSPFIKLIGNFLTNILQPIGKILTPLVNNIIAPLATILVKKLTVQISALQLALTPAMAQFEFLLKILQTIALVAKDLLSLNFSNFGADFKSIWSDWAIGDYAKGSWSSFKGSLGNFFSSGNLPDSSAVAYSNNASSIAIPYSSGTQSIGSDMGDIQQAMYNALVAYGRNSNSNDGTTVINIDGQKVFEAVQRTANRKGLGFSKA